MRRRIAIWASAGFIVAACWALYAFVTTPPAMTSADPIMALVRLTCPIALISFYPEKGTAYEFLPLPFRVEV